LTTLVVFVYNLFIVFTMSDGVKDGARFLVSFFLANKAKAGVKFRSAARHNLKENKMKYKCSIGKKIEACEKCDHVKAHEFGIKCGGTCFAEGHTDNDGKPSNRKIVACVEIPESIEAEEL
jgi:hypothetical protein